MIKIENINKILEKRQLIYIEKQDTNIKVQAEKYKFNYREINYFKSEIDNLFTDLEKAINEKKKVYILLETKEKAKKLKQILEKREIICRIEEKLDKTIIVSSIESIITISVGKLSSGFENHELNQIVIIADELISEEKTKRKYSW